MTTALSSDTWVGNSARGYERTPELQARFDRAAQLLLESDAWVNPDGQKKLVADLALEGGGVKGIGLVGAVLALDEAGYSFARIAATSAGAIVAAVIAALTKADRPMTSLRTYLGALRFSEFMPEGPFRHWLEHTSKAATTIADAAVLSRQMGLYSGKYLEEFLTPILAELGVNTFEDLKITLEDDPGMSLPEGRRYRLVVHVSDITRGVLVQLPWDYKYYGLDAKAQSVVGAVRASMSIPFFFNPVTTQARPVDIEVPQPDGGTILQHHAGGTVTWVDGGLLENFPINAFQRMDEAPGRWPTIGVRLSSLPRELPSTLACNDALSVGLRCIHTLLNEWDSYKVHQAMAARTVFVDNAGLSATQFDLTDGQKEQLFLNGVRAATDFVIKMAAGGRVPRTDAEAQEFVHTPDTSVTR